MKAIFNNAGDQPVKIGKGGLCKGGCALDKLNATQLSDVPQEEKMISFTKALQTIINFDLICISGDFSGSLNNEDIFIERRDAGYYCVPGMQEVLRQLNASERDYRSLKRFFALNSGITLMAGMSFRKCRMELPLLKNLSSLYQLESAIFFSLEIRKRKITLAFFSKQQDGFLDEDAVLLAELRPKIHPLLAAVLSGQQAQRETEKARKIVDAAVSEQRRDEQSPFSGIIGKSPELIAVLENLKIAAPGDTSILILGESGTGKESIAEAVHHLSSRKGKPFVIVNCAALPAALVESELFGHEKGAFTGATERRVGKFEYAEGGTIFLDEIGELPMDSQVKLLRVLQSREIERLGSNELKKINVRIVAATNRDLEKEVAEGRFRLDLYYRLNVFPLELPPLRRRKSDIPELVNYYAGTFAKMSGKEVPAISPAVMNQLMGYPWPGNIRELAHFMERCVLLCQHSAINEITLPRPKMPVPDAGPEDGYIKSFDENEREHILNVLKKCCGRIAGEGGAAELLKVPPTTLNSKIKRLGIQRRHIA